MFENVYYDGSGGQDSIAIVMNFFCDMIAHLLQCPSTLCLNNVCNTSNICLGLRQQPELNFRSILHQVT